jgi:hypothetical protein
MRFEPSARAKPILPRITSLLPPRRHLLIAVLPLVGVAILVFVAIFLVCLAVKISN